MTNNKLDKRMAFELFLSVLLSFPTNVFFIPFIIFFVIMLIDLVFDVFEGLLGELDIVDLDNMTGGSLILPPILTPLMYRYLIQIEPSNQAIQILTRYGLFFWDRL